jgi:23S rRNA (uracil1939-C5)-methyltransferase
MTETFELRIDSIAAGGDGVGRHDGMVAFVPRTSPGDRVRVEAEREGRLMRGRVLEMLVPSASRATPRCGHYDADGCGGCQLQHLPYEGQLEAKSTIIRDALARIGGLTLDAPVVVEPSAAQWRYRAKLTLALRSAGDGWTAGMHPYNAPGRVFALDDCHITDAAVVSHWRGVMQHAHLLPPERELRASVRLIGDGFAFVVEGGREWTTHFELFAAVPAMFELWWQPSGKHGQRLHTRGEPQAGASFTQVNPEVAARLRDWVIAIARAAGPKTAVDAFSGTGDLAVDIAALGARVTAIEIDRDASRLCASRLPAGSRAVASSVEAALLRALPVDFVVLNPPRAGIAATVAATLQQDPRPRTVVYVSCNPATLARDLKRLDRYDVRSVRGFDMFPQTAHVETVCELVPAA